MKYLFQTYDYLLVIASWGAPKEFKHSKYVMEVEELRDSNTERNIIKDEHIYHSSTAAIKDLLWRRVGVNKNRIGVLIFCQDTILIDCIKSKFENLNNKELKRNEFKEELLSELYDQKREVAKELKVYSYKDYENFVRFVPGVITRVEGAYLYTWRGEHCYDLLLGGIIFYTYEKLKEIPRDTQKIAVLLDTTHGINYFVTALKEGVLRATVLYALDRFVEDFDSDASSLKELTIYHYNSDPLSPESRGTPSLKIHLLDKITVVENGQVLLNDIFTSIERYTQGRLDSFWKFTNWEKVHKSLLLFARGVLVWALRVAIDIKDTPTIEDLKRSFDELRLKFLKKEDKKKGKYIECKINYCLTDKNSTAQVVEYALLAALLRKLANKVLHTNDIHNKAFAIIEEISQKLHNELVKTNLYEKVQNILRCKSVYVCFNPERLGKIAKQIYSSPYSDIIINEIKNLEEYLTSRKGVGWRSINKHIYVEPRNRPACIIEYDNIRVLISMPGTVDKRTFYAHGGLVYGLPWFVIPLEGERAQVALCLGEPKQALGLLY